MPETRARSERSGRERASLAGSRSRSPQADDGGGRRVKRTDAPDVSELQAVTTTMLSQRGRGGRRTGRVVVRDFAAECHWRQVGWVAVTADGLRIKVGEIRGSRSAVALSDPPSPLRKVGPEASELSRKPQLVAEGDRRRRTAGDTRERARCFGAHGGESGDAGQQGLGRRHPKCRSPRQCCHCGYSRRQTRPVRVTNAGADWRVVPTLMPVSRRAGSRDAFFNAAVTCCHSDSLGAVHSSEK